MFLAQERADSARLALHSSGSQLTSSLSSLKDGARTALQNSLSAIKNQRFSEDVGERIRHWLAQLKEVLNAVKPSEIYDRIFIFFVTEDHRCGGGCGGPKDS